MTPTSKQYNDMIARARAAGKIALADALVEELAALLLARDVDEGSRETDRLIESAARGFAWGTWNQ